jgi:membrane-bound metal-dependent hydrolase YbcI (DUF457 family)
LDNLTHSLFGLTLARTSLGRAGPGTTSALLLASNAPDIDIVTTAGGAAAYLQWHRGPTHGPLGIVGLGLVVATVVWAVGPMGTRDAASQRAGFGKLCTVSILGVLLHVLMDLPTSYGTRLLSPFDWHWFALDWLPIIDVYLLGILGTGLALGQGRAPHATSQRPRLRPHTARRAASLALSLTAAFYAGRAASHRQALAAASTVLAPLPPRCAPPPMTVDRWPPDAMLGAGRSSAARCLMDLAAIPDFFSPFRWRLIAQMPDRYEISDTDLLARRRAAREHVAGPPLRRAAAYENSWTEAVAGASRSASAQVFLGFSRFPAARWRVDDSGVTTVQWTDLRFVPPPSIDQSGRNLFFTITVRLDASGRILDERLGS